ncbi:hypothetical protein CFP56_020988 [Quercus suber]|uniref:Uncharacterized protein n=1 Tax=Quercus suber TaxID=58331 RepID=A0AAW0LZW6_QUESU
MAVRLIAQATQAILWTSQMSLAGSMIKNG